jgi:hypothetical protein
MTDTPEYTPPKVWIWPKNDGPNWRYSNTNRPVAGATHEKELPHGKHPLQLYSLATPNGVKVTIMPATSNAFLRCVRRHDPHIPLTAWQAAALQ